MMCLDYIFKCLIYKISYFKEKKKLERLEATQNRSINGLNKNDFLKNNFFLIQSKRILKWYLSE